MTIEHTKLTIAYTIINKCYTKLLIYYTKSNLRYQSTIYAPASSFNAHMSADGHGGSGVGKE